MRRKEWMRVVAALAAFAVLGTGSAVTAAAEETGTVVSETDSTADKTVFTGSCGEDATWTYDKSSGNADDYGNRQRGGIRQGWCYDKDAGLAGGQ